MKKIIFHPFLFALYPVLFLYARNIREIQFINILNSLIAVLTITVFVFIIIKIALRDIKKTGIIVSLFVLLIFGYGHVYETIKNNWIKHWHLLSLWAIIFLVGLFFTIKTERNLHKFSKILNAVALLLILITTFNIVFYKIRTKDVWQNIENSSKTEFINVSAESPENLPDIYYIIFDRYADNETIKKIYNYDNSEFTDWLTERGFYVAEDSRSNYLVTPHSLASSLNMEHITYFADQPGEDCGSMQPLYTILQSDYNAWKFLKARGYTYIHAGSWWPPTNKNSTADVNLNLYTTSDFAILLYSKTAFYPLSAKLGLDISIFRGLSKNAYVYDTTLNQFKNIMKVPDLRQPTYMFVHFLVPHDPYVFDENGNFQSEEEIEKRTHYENYQKQLIYTNKRIKEFVEQIIIKSQTPPIIILQADEGPYPQRWIGDQGQYLNWAEESDEGFRIKTSILNALYLPGTEKKDLYPSISPVNTFRYIYNRYFKTNFDMLPDKVYAHFDVDHPYKFFEITERVKKSE